MIERQEVEDMARRLDIHTSHVQRDYVHGWILSQLYQHSSLGSRLTLKGGNAFRKGYFGDFRYSRDLDFSTSARLAEAELRTELRRIGSLVQERAGVEFDLDRVAIKQKRGADEDKEISEARLYFRDFYGVDSPIILGVRLDVSEFDRLYLPVQERPLLHAYSDAQACEATIRCLKLEELLALKMRCLLQRRHIADLYDLAFPLLRGETPAVNRGEVIRTFLRITIFRPSPRIAKGLFIDLPLEALGRFWHDYILTPAQSRFSFDEARASMLDLIETLIPGEPIQDRSVTFFPSTLRNPIMAAGADQRLLRMSYDGVVRLVEPYSLTFKVRRDGVGREYFYAYDTTGGRSSPPGIKCFLPGKIESLDIADETFEPRYDVDLGKAGGSDTITRFRGGRRARASASYRYIIVCPVCNKRFRRKKRGTRLRRHKAPSGFPCPGRTGYYD